MVTTETLAALYDTIEKDNRLGPVHVSLYIALLFANSRAGINPFVVERKLLMKAAKINARSTFEICINQLENYHYLEYEPSKGLGMKSMVHLRKLF